MRVRGNAPPVEPAHDINDILVPQEASPVFPGSRRCGIKGKNTGRSTVPDSTLAADDLIHARRRKITAKRPSE